MKYQMFKREALRNQCRDCINQSYRLTLARRDCVYLPYPERCSSCGEVRNIVAEVSRRKRWKLFLIRRSESPKEGSK